MIARIYVLIFLFFLSSSMSGLFGNFLGFLTTASFCVAFVFWAFLVSFILFYEISFFSNLLHLKLNSWISLDLLNIDFGFLFDNLTVSMCVVVTFISFLVHLYSTDYMSHDPHLLRFIAYLSLFTFFMLVLTTSDNFIQMFLGWEGVGLCSYLLINFWFTRVQANKAAIKAMLINRVGDFSLLIGLILIFINFQSLDYLTLTSLVSFLRTEKIFFFNFDLDFLSVVGCFLFLGAVGKSAQLGLHTWLPDAMEGPTPVSALIHAATMVTAGVFLLARGCFIYEHINNVSHYITILGSATAFFSATVGLSQNDMKRVVAYSTCSQLGYMIFACGLSNYSVGMFHLINHAFFKALLFLGAGSIIHSINDEQDMRKVGGLKDLLPFTYSVMIMGSLALIGFPFLAGFYSKDLVLEVSYGKYTLLGYTSFCLGTVGAFLTAYYSVRLVFLSFLSKPTSHKRIIVNAIDSDARKVRMVLTLLAVPSIFVGYLLKDTVLGLGSFFFSTSVNTLITNFNILDSEFIDIFYKILPVNFSILSVILALITYILMPTFLYKLKTLPRMTVIYNFLNRKWFFDKIYNFLLGQKLFNIAFSISYKLIDRGVLEILGPAGISVVSFIISKFFNKIQTGIYYHYNLIMVYSFSVIMLLNSYFKHLLLKISRISLLIFMIFSEILPGTHLSNSNNIAWKVFLLLMCKKATGFLFEIAVLLNYDVIAGFFMLVQGYLIEASLCRGEMLSGFLLFVINLIILGIYACGFPLSDAFVHVAFASVFLHLLKWVLKQIPRITRFIKKSE